MAEIEKTSVKSEVEEKINKQIEKKRAKEEGNSRILEYLKTEHKWENYLFVALSLITLLLGCLILNGSLVVKENVPLIGTHPTVFGWILVGFAGAGLIYSLYPFFKPAFPEFKKINWPTWAKFLGDSIRTVIFLVVFTGLFMLYETFITELLSKIIK